MDNMQPQRQTATDSLADIIQIALLGNKTGTLMVERGEGETLEEGFLKFCNGNVTEASVGRYRGVNAFNHLNTWKKCRFSFEDEVTNPSDIIQPQIQIYKTNNPSFPERFPHHTASSVDNYVELNAQGGQSFLPIRLQLGEVILQHPEASQLPRLHRRLLLLVNGQRSVSELARLMARKSEEIQPLLDDLEHNGLIGQ
jgi:hypothetical protein